MENGEGGRKASLRRRMNSQRVFPFPSLAYAVCNSFSGGGGGERARAGVRRRHSFGLLLSTQLPNSSFFQGGVGQLARGLWRPPTLPRRWEGG